MKTAGFRRLVLPGLLTLALLAATLGVESISRGLLPWLPPFDPGWGRIALVTASGFAGAWLASRLIEVALTRSFARNGRRPPRLLFEMIAVALFGAAVFWVLSAGFERPITGALATSGVLIAVLGFALRGIIADVFYGIALSLENAYRIGDWIETETGARGRVIEINWRSTRLQTRSRTHIVIPNSRIAAGRLINYSSPRPHYRIDVPITLDFDVPVERAKRILLAALMSTPGIRRTPIPDVRIESYDDRGIRYRMRFWLPSFAEEIDCRDAVMASVDRHLRIAGIGMPRGREHVVYRREQDTPKAKGALAERLSRLPALAGAAPEDLAQLASIAGIAAVAAGERVGEEDDALFFVLEGVLQTKTDDGASVLIGPGDLLGTLPADAPPLPFGAAAAITEAVLLRLPAAPLRAILVSKRDLARRIAEAARRSSPAEMPSPAQRSANDPEMAKRSFWSRLGALRGAASGTERVSAPS